MSTDWVPGAARVRVIVDQADGQRCGLAVGDCFEVDGSTLTLPLGRPFCHLAMAAVFPVLALRQTALPKDDWLIRKPFVCCPMADERVVLRLEPIEDDRR
jgi:uncharacterized repeat protein (TIGR04076 family)